MLFTTLAFVLGMAQAAQAGMPATGAYLNSDGPPILQLIQNTQHTLDIEIYTMQDPEVHALLRDALSRGVKIRVVEEPNPDGSTCDLFGNGKAVANVDMAASASSDCTDLQKLMSQIQAAGGTFVPYDKANLCPNGGGSDGSYCYEHGKIAIADQGLSDQTLVISTGNFDDTNLCIASEKPGSCDRDFTMVVNDATVIGTMENLFNADLKGTSYDVRTLIPSSLQNTLVVSPYALQPLVDFVNSATTSLDIETQYLEDPTLNAAIVAVAKRGISVNVTTASICSFGKPSASEAKSTQSIYNAFDKAGISTAMFNSSNLINGIPGYLHAKVIVVDGTRAWLGSENGSTTSLTENREYGIFFDDAASVNTVYQVMRADHASPDSETWEDSLNCAKDSGSVSSTGDVPPPSSSKPPKKPKPGKSRKLTGMPS